MPHQQGVVAFFSPTQSAYDTRTLHQVLHVTPYHVACLYCILSCILRWSVISRLYPEPDKSNPLPHAVFSSNLSTHTFYNSNFVHVYHCFCACNIVHPFCHGFEHPDSIRWRVQIVKLVTTHFHHAPVCYCFISMHFHQCSVLKHHWPE